MAPSVVKCYDSLKKKDKTKYKGRAGLFRVFFALRAVGLAVEEGFKLCRDVGLGDLKAEQLNQVRVSGDLQMLVAGNWKEASEVRLQLRAQDAALARAVVARALLRTLYFFGGAGCTYSVSGPSDASLVCCVCF